MKVILHIESSYDKKTVEVSGELSIGRTDQAKLQLDDSGLSRVNTTVFIDDGEVLLADENSTNGTFLNGEKIAGRPRVLRDGDRIKIGTFTNITVEIRDGSAAQPVKANDAPAAASTKADTTTNTVANLPVAAPDDEDSSKAPMLLIAAAVLTILIIIFGAAALFLIPKKETTATNQPGKLPTISSGSVIPIRVIDPLGGEDENDLDDVIASWEFPEEEINAGNVSDVAVSSADTEEKDLNVTAAFLAEQQKKALEARPGEGGVRPAGLSVPKELFGDGVIKQKAKLKMMNTAGYRQPLDFADLAEKRMNRELVEMPMATTGFYLDVGGSAQDLPFTSFSFEERNQPILGGSPKYGILSKLAGNFAGQKYDLNNASDRKQMRMRLLRMFNPRAKDILKELANAYFKEFGRPLRVTSLTRSMDYQILLNAGNANSFPVRGAGSLPPHTSGCAFDLARKHMPVQEQNFVMKKLAEMENAGKLDALIEYGVNACFHIFIYDDGNAPKM